MNVDSAAAEDAFERTRLAFDELDRIQLARCIGRAIAHLPRTTKRLRLGRHLLRTAPKNWRDYTLKIGPSGECWDHVWTHAGLAGPELDAPGPDD